MTVLTLPSNSFVFISAFKIIQPCFCILETEGGKHTLLTYFLTNKKISISIIIHELNTASTLRLMSFLSGHFYAFTGACPYLKGKVQRGGLLLMAALYSPYAPIY